jgi:hypothetical protein
MQTQSPKVVWGRGSPKRTFPLWNEWRTGKGKILKAEEFPTQSFLMKHLRKNRILREEIFISKNPDCESAPPRHFREFLFLLKEKNNSLWLERAHLTKGGLMMFFSLGNKGSLKVDLRMAGKEFFFVFK